MPWIALMTSISGNDRFVSFNILDRRRVMTSKEYNDLKIQQGAGEIKKGTTVN